MCRRGGNEQMFGANKQNPHGARSDAFCFLWHYTLHMLRIVTIAGIAALLMTTAAHADTLPEAFVGEWCWIAGGDKKENLNQQIFVRPPPKNCQGGDNGITVDQDGWGGEGSCFLIR
jgi:hypothetical protein